MENIIHTFKGGNLFETTTELFKHLNISTKTFEEQAFLPQDFLKDLYKPEKHKAINEIYLVGIVTDEVFNGKSLDEVDNELSNDYQGLLIIAVDLKDKIANRTELSTLTRLFSRRLKAMPVAVLFRYGNHIALTNAERTQYKQTYREGEKIGKVSILKDIDTLKPHRGHLRILEKLQVDKSIKTFKELYAKWLGVFDIKILNKEFYKELFAWYEWAISETSGIKYPNDPKAIKEERQLEKQIIRLITRVLFVWFIKQKGLVPEEIFDEKALSGILKDFDPKSETKGEYYNAILQNLFFATLNKEITERAFAKEKNSRDVKTLYRYAEMFSISEEKVIELFKPVPFLNGGLFECLDKDQGNDGKRYHLDGFSRNENTKEDGNRFRQRTLIPNIFFFEKDKGLFSILNKYYFTVEENTPEEVQVALDPELLGNVFENLLGAFNPETEESARKLSGSFYTPKEVVNYMVDESLKVYLKNHLPSFSSKLIDELFEGQDLTADFDDITKRKQIAECLRKVKILDPACGSGAFPMGILNRMVYILEKLGVDINETNYQLKRYLIEKCIYGVDIQTTATQISKLRFFISLILEQSETNTDPALNYGIQPLPNLETKFVTANTLIQLKLEEQDNNTLGLSDNNDIELKKLKEELLNIRYNHFYAKSVSEKIKYRKEDEAKREQIKQHIWDNATQPNTFNISIWEKEIAKQRELLKNYINEKWQDIQQTNLFGETTSARVDVNEPERRNIENRINTLESSIEKEKHKTAPKGLRDELNTLASWNPYDQNASAPFFDPEWMFGISDGFDIIIGNPPYINIEKIDKDIKARKKDFRTAYKKYDLYVLFYEKGIDWLEKNGVLSYITSNKFLSQEYGLFLRQELLKNTIKLIVNFNYDIFENATVRTCILLLTKALPKTNNIIELIDVKNEKDAGKFINREYEMIFQNIFNTTEYNNFRINLTEEKMSILDKIDKKSIKLEEVCSVNYGLRPSSEILGLKKESFISKDKKDGYKAYFEGKDMGYWKVLNHSFLDYQPKVMYNPMFEELFDNPKLVGLRTLSDIGKLRFIYDNKGYYCNDSVVILTLWYLFENVNNSTIKRNISNKKIELSKEFDYKYLQGVLNSKLIKFYVNELFYDGTHFYPNQMKALPIKKASSAIQQLFITLVNMINYLQPNVSKNIFIHTSNIGVASHFQDILDMMVYELYFEVHTKEAGLDVLQFIKPMMEEIQNLPINEQIERFYKWYQQSENKVRQRVLLLDTRSENLLAIINKII